MSIRDGNHLLRVEGMTPNKSFYAYGESILLKCTVNNLSDNTIFLVQNRMYKSKQDKNALDILSGETVPPDNLDYYQYRVPRFLPVKHQQVRHPEFRIGMPLTEPFIDENGDYQEREVLLFGDVTIALRVGFVTEPFRLSSPDPWRDFVRLQQIVPAGTVSVRISSPES